MTKVDRRIRKSQEAIKAAVIELMSEKNFDDITLQDISDRADVSRGTIYLHYVDKYDLLDKLIDGHIQELSEICHSVSDLEWKESIVPWFTYLEQNYLFFSTMMASKGAGQFRNRLVEFLNEDFKEEVHLSQARKSGLSEDIILQYVVMSYVGVVEWWIKNEMPYPPEVMSEQLGELIKMNLG
ncbi:TetR/AcrR family transcriptional regulator [Paenibacillus marchantiae]|uniref:TetR/AcrR family transcriptional regulator n=1 Tax=Paenibacillus marchantiae TaxID=3026433 RepID=UPI00237B3813|nr:TetR/AcrR family transcriptional regulator [Paenibacillus marchantiae]WDQ30698.1 TetR/AcrR family transcriptional regulator [Paenibacillus marchantiae]